MDCLIISIRLTLSVCLFAIANYQACSAVDLEIQGEPWPEADQLFKRDSRWRGADAANSIDLGSDRVLWTFGDTFVDAHREPKLRRRKGAKLIRNSVAIQRGYDPTCAKFHPAWQEDPAGKVSAFFRAEGEAFYWPGGGLMLDERLLVFLMRIRNSSEHLGFSVVGWGAVLVDNPQDDPNSWNMEFLRTPQNLQNILVGSGSSIRQGDWIYSFGSGSSRRHQLYLTRVLVSDAKSGNFSKLQWWHCSDACWRKQAEIERHPPEPILDNGQVEFTVHCESQLQSFLLLQFDGFPQAPLAFRYARKLTGPWSPPQSAYVPEETDDSNDDLMIYASKAHPEQQAEGLAVTYCTNTKKLATVIDNVSLYYPRFVRLVFNTQEDAK